MFFIKKRETDWNENYKEFAKKYTNPDFSQNRILAQRVYLNMNTRATLRNNSVCILANPHQTRFFLHANLMQANCNWVLPDYNGVLLGLTQAHLQSKGYQVHVINCSNAFHGIHYDIFHNMQDYNDENLAELAHEIMRNVFADPFLDRASRELLTGLLRYVNQLPEENRNLESLRGLLSQVTQSGNPDALDELFWDIDDDIIKTFYKHWKCVCRQQEAIKSARVILECLRYYTPMHKDAFKWSDMATGKHVVFIQYSTPEQLKLFWYPLLSQAIHALQIAADQAEKHVLEYNTTLVVPFAHDDLSVSIAVARKKNISFILTPHSLKQLQQECRNNWMPIIDNCDSIILSHIPDMTTAVYFSKELGNRVIHTTSVVKPPKRREAQCYCPRPIISPEELMKLADDDAIVYIRGMKPFKTKTYKTE